MIMIDNINDNNCYINRKESQGPEISFSRYATRYIFEASRLRRDDFWINFRLLFAAVGGH